MRGKPRFSCSCSSNLFLIGLLGFLVSEGYSLNIRSQNVTVPCGCFGHDGTPDATCAIERTEKSCRAKIDAFGKLPCNWKDTCKPAQLGEPCCPKKSQKACTERMRAPLCDTGLKCYGPDLAGSDGVCMNASSLANKGEKCCIFCHTAPPCDTGLRCNCGDPNDEGVCTDPWFLVGAGDAEKSPVVCSACNSNFRPVALDCCRRYPLHCRFNASVGCIDVTKISL